MGESLPSDLFPETLPTFQPCQIVCLEHGQDCLYSEVVQVIPNRQLCWARPLALTVVAPPGRDNPGQSRFSGEEPRLTYDLRYGSDLLWPLRLFRPALDTEMVDILPHLRELTVDRDPRSKQIAHQHLHQFMQQVWQAHPQAFQT